MELLQRSLVFYGHTGDGVGTQWRRCGYRNRKLCSAVAVDAASPITNTSGIRWGLSKLQGKRPEMEDDVVIRSEGLGDFTFAALFDGHAGFSSVEFLKDELYMECVAVLQGGLLLDGKNITATRNAMSKAFEKVDSKLSSWLENKEVEDESGSTATVLFLRDDVLIVSHVGDSSVVVSRYGKEEVLTGPHRPYGNNNASIGEIKRIKAAGGWISNGRICGEISVSRSFGDIRFKKKKNELLKQGVVQGRWTEKFISRVQFKGDLVVATPDINYIDLGNDVEFIILASDGLWDYMKSSDAVTFVRSELCQHGDVQIACEALAQAALGRDSEDNISVVIADLGRTDWRNLSVQGSNMFYEMSQVVATIAAVFAGIGIWMSSFLRV